MPKIVRFHQTGPAEVLKIEDLPLQEPGDGEVRLKVQAIGLNRAEVMFRYGRYLDQPAFPSRIGYEASGIVDAVGPGVTGFKVGDKVSTIPAFSMTRYGVYGESAVVPARAVAHYPENLNPQQATSIWMQYLTAWGGLVYHGKLKAGEWVLITAGGSSVAIAALQIARALGGKTIVTTRTSAKKKMLQEAGADAVVAIQEENLPERVAQITGSADGVHLVFDPIAGPLLEQLAKSTRRGGQIIEYGALAIEPTPYPLFAALSKALVIRGYTLFEITGSAGPARDEAVAFVSEQLKKGTLVPRIDRVFPLDQIVEAHRYMEANEQIGKIVVSVS